MQTNNSTPKQNKNQKTQTPTQKLNAQQKPNAPPKIDPSELMRIAEQARQAELDREVSIRSGERDEGRETLGDALKNKASEASNVVTVEKLKTKLNAINKKASFMVDLLSLSAVEWKLVGRSDAIIDSEMARRQDKMGISVSQGTKKRLMNHTEILKSINKYLSLNEKEASFLSIGNLYQTDLGVYLGDFAKLGSLAYVVRSSRKTLEYAQNAFLPKVMPQSELRELMMHRYQKIFLLILKGDAGDADVPENTHIQDVDPYSHDPRQWATVVNPRRVLLAKNSNGDELSLTDKKEILGWVRDTEYAMMSLAKIQNTHDFTLKRYIDGNRTGYWENMVSAYKFFGERLNGMKATASGETPYVKWDEIEVDALDAEGVRAKFFLK